MMPAQNRLQRVVSTNATMSRFSIEVINDLHATTTDRIVIGRGVWPHKDREDMPIHKAKRDCIQARSSSHTGAHDRC